MRVLLVAFQRVQHRMHRPKQRKGSTCPGANRPPANAKGRYKANNRNQHSHRTHGQPSKAVLALRNQRGKGREIGQIKHQPTSGNAQQNCCRGCQFEQGIDPWHFWRSKIFGYGPIEGGAKNGGLQPHQKHHSNNDCPVHAGQRPYPKKHGRQLHNL